MLKAILRFILKLFGLDLKEDNNYVNKNNVWYTKKSIMTTTEIKFYNQFKEMIGDKYLIWPQINLASVITKNNTTYYKKKYQNELYRNIDFGIFDKNSFELILLIELNDNTHNSQERRKRDENVKVICNKCGYNIITFWLNKPNEYEYMKNRILYYLGEIDIKNDQNMPE